MAHDRAGWLFCAHRLRAWQYPHRPILRYRLFLPPHRDETRGSEPRGSVSGRVVFKTPETGARAVPRILSNRTREPDDLRIFRCEARWNRLRSARCTSRQSSLRSDHEETLKYQELVYPVLHFQNKNLYFPKIIYHSIRSHVKSPLSALVSPPLVPPHFPPHPALYPIPPSLQARQADPRGGAHGEGDRVRETP